MSQDQIAYTAKRPQAECRGCGRPLAGAAYHLGEAAPVLESGERARRCWYGGWVCSRECDESACARLESSQPGSGGGRGALSGDARRQIAINWPH